MYNGQSEELTTKLDEAQNMLQSNQQMIQYVAHHCPHLFELVLSVGIFGHHVSYSESLIRKMRPLP